MIKLETDRLIIRTIDYTDAVDFYEYASRSDLGPKAGWEPHKNVKETKEVINYFLDMMAKGKSLYFSIIRKADHKMIGTIEIYNIDNPYVSEIGYSLNPMYHNLGYGYEAACAIVSYAFNTLNRMKLEAGMYTDNLASIKLITKLGFHYEGTLKKHFVRAYDGLVFDEAFYGLTKKEYLKDCYERNRC